MEVNLSSQASNWKFIITSSPPLRAESDICCWSVYLSLPMWGRGRAGSTRVTQYAGRRCLKMLFHSLQEARNRWKIADHCRETHFLKLCCCCWLTQRLCASWFMFLRSVPVSAVFLNTVCYLSFCLRLKAVYMVQRDALKHTLRPCAPKDGFPWWGWMRKL